MCEKILVLVAVCIATVAARPQSIVTSDMSLDMLPAEELDLVLDELHYKHLTNLYNDYEEGLKMHENHRRQIFHEHQRKRRKRQVADHLDHSVDDDVTKSKILFNDAWHNFIVDTGMNNRQVVVIDDIKQKEFVVGDEIIIEKAFPLHFFHLDMPALFKSEDSHGYIIDNNNQNMSSLEVCNEFTVSRSGCSCTNATEEDSKMCACCILGGCLCDEYGIKDACVQCGKEEETCLTGGHQKLKLESATAFTYHLDSSDREKGCKNMFAITLGSEVKFYTWNDGILMHKRLEDGRASLSFGSNFSQIAYADTFIDYKGDLIKKRFMFTFEHGEEGKQLYHELEIDPKLDILRILSTRVWKVTGQFMKTIQSGGHIYILLCDYENEINLYDFRADKYRNFDPWFIQKFKFDETPLEVEIFTSHFDQILLITTASEARIYKIKGNTFEHLQSLKPEIPITKFENIVPIKMKECGVHEVLLAVEGTDAIPYVWNGYNENYTRLSGRTVPKDIYWSQAVSCAKYENSGEVFVPGKSNVLRLDITGHLEELPDPTILLYEKVHKHLEKIETEFDHQKKTIDATLVAISKSIHNSSIIHGAITLDSSDIDFKGALHTNELNASEIMIDESLAGQSLTSEVYKATLQQLEEEVDQWNKTIIEHEMVLLDAVPKNKIEETKIIGTKKIKDGNIKIKALQVRDLNVTQGLHNEVEIPLHKTIKDIVRRDYPGSVKGRKTFSTNTTIFRLVTAFLDDIPVSDLVTQDGDETIEGALYKKGLFVKEDLTFSENATAAGKDPNEIVCDATNRIHRLGRCRFNKTLNVQGDLPIASGIVDGINVNNLAHNTLKKNGPSFFNKLLNISYFIIVEGNIVTDSVMGINFTEFLENVVFKNKPSNISGHLTYESDVTIQKSLFVGGLINNKSFPSDYPLTSDTHIDFGNKHFEVLEADNITVQGLVDEKKPEHFFTKTTNQTVNDTKTFDCGIDVIGDLNVGSGLIDGLNISSLNFINDMNYTEIKTIVFKKNLKVESLNFTGYLNGFDFKEAVNDLVFCDEDEAIIDSVKTFNNLAVRYVDFHSTVNNEKVSAFVTTDKDQIINGHITFNEVTHFISLDVDGTVDGVDIDSLYSNALYLDKPEQIVKGTKIFSGNITIESLKVHVGINDVDFTRVFTKSGVQNIGANQNFTNANFENIEIKNIHLRDSALIDGVDIDDFLKKRLTIFGAQSIQGNIVIDCPVNGTTLHSERINGYDLDDLVNDLVVHDATVTINTEVVFSSMEVLGPIKTKEQRGANGLSLAKIAANAFLLEGSENYMNYGNFEHLEVNDISINGLVDGVDIESLINDAVFGDDTTNISVTGNKIFTSGLQVHGDIDAAMVNGLNYSSQLLLKKWDQIITGRYGFEDIKVMKNVILTGSFNEIDMEDFEKDATERENVIVEELELPKVNVAACGGIAKASSSHESGNHPPMNAFEEAGFWQSLAPYTVPQSLWVEFGYPLRVVKYSFRSRTDNIKYVDTDGPSKYIFWASNYEDCNEETQWVILHMDNSGTPFAKSNDPKIVTIENSDFYRCYGFKVTNVPGRDDANPVTIANIHLYSIIDKVILTQNRTENGTVKWLGTGNGTVGRMDVYGQFNNLTVFDVYNEAVCENTSEILGKIKLEIPPVFSNLNIKTLNGTDFESVLSDVVFKNSDACIFENDLKIDGGISANDINVNETNIKGKLDRTVYEDLFKEAVYLSKDHNISSHWNFVGGAVIYGNLDVKKLRDIPLNDYLTTHAPQNITHSLKFDKLTSDHVNVLGTVNGLNLTEEYRNTLFGTGDEVVTGNKTLLGLILVDGDVHTNQTGREIKIDISEDTIEIHQQTEVAIEGGIQFTGPLNVNAFSLNGLVNSVDLDEMFTNAWYNDEPTNLAVDMRFEGLVIMEGALNRNMSHTEDYDIKEIYEQGNSLISHCKELLHIIHSKFSETCDSTVHMYKLMENSIYDADYLQVVTSFKSAGVHRSSTTFIMNGTNYVLVNWQTNCNSSIYRWNTNTNSLIYDREFESGFAYNWIVIPYADPSYVQLVMSAGWEQSHCNNKNTTIWDVESVWDLESNRTRINIQAAQKLPPSIGVSVMGANYRLKLNLYNDHDRGIIEYMSDENGDFELETRRKDEINKYLFGYNTYGSEIGFEVSVAEVDSIQNTSSVNVFEDGRLLSSHILHYVILDALALEEDGKVLLMLLLKEPILESAALAEDLYYITVYEYDFDDLLFVLMSYEMVHGSGSLETFTTGNEASRLIFVTFIQDHGPIIIYNLLGETMKLWTELPIYVPTWSLPFNVRQANGYGKAYLLLGWDETQEVIILTMEMRGFTVPPYEENCIVPERNMTILHHYFQYLNETR